MPKVRQIANTHDEQADGDTAWTNLDNTLQDDSNKATITIAGGTSSHSVRYDNFNFNIPTDAVIDKINVYMRLNDSGLGLMSHQLMKAGTPGGDTVQINPIADDEITWYKVEGSTNDLWNDTWTPANINHADFGVEIQLGTSSGSVSEEFYAVEIEIIYSLAEMDRSKYDVKLDNQGFRITELTKDSAPDFAPRFNTGREGENDLDFYKSKSLIDFSGGMMQKQWVDDRMVDLIQGVYNIGDGYLYPSLAKSAVFGDSNTGEVADDRNYDAGCIYKGDLWVSEPTYDGGVENGISKYESDGTRTEVTCSAGLLADDAITDMISWKGFLYVACGDDGDIYRYDTSSWTVWSSVGAQQLAVLGGNLYRIKSAGYLAVATDTTTADWTYVDNVGEGEDDSVNDFKQYQNRLYMAKKDGLWAYDGVQTYKFLDQEFEELQEYRGWLYMRDANKLYRTNGITVELLYDLTTLGSFTGQMQVVKDRLWFGFTASVIIDIGGKFSYFTDAGEYALYYFDGVGMFRYDSFATTASVFKNIFSAHDRIHMGLKAFDTGVSSFRYLYEWDLPNEFDVTNSTLSFNNIEIVTSEFDGGYPNVPKSLHRVEVDALDDTSEIATIAGTVTHSPKDEVGDWLSYSTIATITDRYTQKQDLVQSEEFYSSRLGVTMTGNAPLKRLSFRWTLHPRRRNRWSVGLLCVGADDYSPEEQVDGTESTLTPKALREKVYSLNRSNVPIWFSEVDYTLADGAHNTTVETIDVDDTSMFDESGTVRAGNELITYKRKTATKLLECTRGAWGTTASSISDNDQIEPVYRAYVTRIMSERYLLDSNTKNIDTGGATDDAKGLESEILVEIVEV